MKAIDMIKQGLNARQVYVLEQLAVGDKTSCELANDYISTASLVQIIDKLEKQNLVVRERSKDDRRKVYISITKKGKQLIDRKGAK